MKFYRLFFSIALPVALQELVSSGLNLIDNLMIGSLGVNDIAGVGIANQIFFLFILTCFGVCSGASIFTAQYWGQKDKANMRRMIGICLICSSSLALIFMSGALIFAEKIIGIFSDDAEVIHIGSSYIRWVCPSYILSSITMSYAINVRASENAKLPLAASVCGLAFNTVWNYILIFGKFGFPAMGAVGAAIATVGARIVEVSVLIGVIYAKKYIQAAKWSEMFSISKELFVSYIKKCVPVVINEGGWALGIVSYSWVFGQMGKEVLAASSISQTVERVAMVFLHGIAAASVVMIGKIIGKGSKKAAFVYAKKFSVMSVLTGLAVGLILILSARFIVMLYNVPDAVKSNAVAMLSAIGILMFVKSFNTTNIIGILRSGGDTAFSAVIDVGTVFLVGLPMAYLGGIILKLPVFWVYMMILLDEVCKLILGVPRLFSKKWINNVTVKE